MEYLIGLAIVFVLVIVTIKLGLKRVTIHEYERGLKYVRGICAKVLEPGVYWYSSFFTTLYRIDVRPRFVSITGQEVLSSDGVTIKMSLAVNFQIVDAKTAINEVADYQEALYIELQLALRQIIGSEDIDSILSGRDKLSEKLLEMTEGKAHELGLKLISVSIKDIMFPGKLKEMFAQVVSARKEGLASLEKARGEVASLRHLANAAKMIESNPNLMQLRLVQALSESSGNTLILGMSGEGSPIPIRTGASQSKPKTTGED